MKFTHLIPVLAVVFTTGSCESTDKTGQPRSEIANQFFLSGDFNKAYNLFIEVIEENPEDLQALFKKASAGIALGKFTQSRIDLDTLLELSPGHTKALIQRAKISIKFGQLDKALEDLMVVSETTPENLVVKQMIKEVKEAQSKAQKLEESGFIGTPEQTMEILSDLINASPHWVEMRKKRASFALTQNKFDEAVGDWTKVVQISPSDHDTLLNLARVHYFFYHEPSQALNKVKQFLHYDPEHKKFKALFRTIKQMEKKLALLDAATKKKAWSEVISLVEGSEETTGLSTLIGTTTTELQTEFQTQHLGPNKLHGKLYKSICLAYSRTKNPLTVDFCTKALDAFPEDYKTMVARSEGYLLKELYEKAIEDLTKAFELSDKDKKVHEKLQKAKKLLKQSKQKDYYKILGVSRSAGPKEIKKAFLKKAREWHPDTYKGDLPQDQVEKKMADINQAYEVLSDEELKARFDRGDDPNDPTGGQGHHEGNPFAHHGGGNPFEFVFQKGGGFGGFGGHSHFEFNF